MSSNELPIRNNTWWQQEINTIFHKILMRWLAGVRVNTPEMSEKSFTHEMEYSEVDALSSPARPDTQSRQRSTWGRTVCPEPKKCLVPKVEAPLYNDSQDWWPAKSSEFEGKIRCYHSSPSWHSQGPQDHIKSLDYRTSLRLIQTMCWTFADIGIPDTSSETSVNGPLNTSWTARELDENGRQDSGVRFLNIPLASRISQSLNSASLMGVTSKMMVSLCSGISLEVTAVSENWFDGFVELLKLWCSRQSLSWLATWWKLAKCSPLSEMFRPNDEPWSAGKIVTWSDSIIYYRFHIEQYTFPNYVMLSKRGPFSFS